MNPEAPQINADGANEGSPENAPEAFDPGNLDLEIEEVEPQPKAPSKPLGHEFELDDDKATAAVQKKQTDTERDAAKDLEKRKDQADLNTAAAKLRSEELQRSRRESRRIIPYGPGQATDIRDTAAEIRREKRIQGGDDEALLIAEGYEIVRPLRRHH